MGLLILYVIGFWITMVVMVFQERGYLSDEDKVFIFIGSFVWPIFVPIWLFVKFWSHVLDLLSNLYDVYHNWKQARRKAKALKEENERIAREQSERFV